MDIPADCAIIRVMTDSVFHLFHAAFGASHDATNISLAPDRYLSDLRGYYRAEPTVLLRPNSREQVAEYVRFCGQNGIGIIPYGGGTGLVGGQMNVPVTGDKPPDNPPKPNVLLSLDRLNKIRTLSPESNTITVEAGVILADIHARATAHNRLFPLSIGSAGTCQIGGNLATNAGGMQVLRYGMMRDLCLGVEAILPDGQIYNGLTGLRKDNTGYDLRHLLIGSEGTLGVITAAVLRLYPMPKHHLTCFVALKNADAALSVLNHLQEAFDGQVSVCELVSRASFDFMAETFPNVRRPFADAPEWSVLVEIGLQTDASDRFETCLSGLYQQGLITDAQIAQSSAARRDFWTFRETIPEANRAIGTVASHDISLPLARIGAFIADMPAKIAQIGDFRINCFGHIGDGNLHYNIFPPKGQGAGAYKNARSALQRVVYDGVSAFGGSISAEHGIGRLKRDDLVRYGDAAKLTAMRGIKSALDPQGIMNPGAVFSC